jgi:hypothetical protein
MVSPLHPASSLPSPSTRTGFRRAGLFRFAGQATRQASNAKTDGLMSISISGRSWSFALLAVSIGTTSTSGCSFGSAPEATGTTTSADTCQCTPAPPAPTGVLPPGIQAISDITGVVANVFGAFQAVSFLVQLIQNDSSEQAYIQTIQTDLMDVETSLSTTLSNVQWNLGKGQCDTPLLAEQGDLQSILEQVSQNWQTVPNSEAAFTDTNSKTKETENSLCFDRLANPFTLGWGLSYGPGDLTSIGNPPADTTAVFSSSSVSGVPLYLYWQWVLGAAVPDANGNVFDWRLGVPNFVAAIAMRIAAIGASDPNFATDGTYTAELNGYSQILQQQLSKMLNGVKCGFQARDLLAPLNIVTSAPAFPADFCGTTIQYTGHETAMLTCADINTGLNVTKDYTSTSVLDFDYYEQYCSLAKSGTQLSNALSVSVSSNSPVGQMQAEVAGELDIMRRQVLVQMPIFETQAMINTLYVFTHGGVDLEYPKTPRIALNYDYFCLDATALNGAVLIPCARADTSQQFVYDRAKNRIYNSESGLDLSVDNNQLGTNIVVGMAAPSQPPGAGQMWTYDPQKQVIMSKLGTVLAVPQGHLDDEYPPLIVEDPTNDSYEQFGSGFLTFNDVTDGIFRPAGSQNNSGKEAQWFLSYNNITDHTDVGPYNYGSAGDIPIVGDWDGNGTFTDGVFRPAGSPNNPSSQAQWFLSNSDIPDHTDIGPFYYGNAGDLPVVGDWDGNGTFTVGLFRPAGSPNNSSGQAQWFLSNSNIANNTDIGPFYYGNAGDLPVVGDWDGNSTFTVGLFRPAGSPNNSSSQAQWFLSNSNIANNTDIGPFYYGSAGDLPVVGDWDGNGTFTVGTFRPAGSPNNSASQAQWFLSNNNVANHTDIGPFYYGNAGDLPIVGRWAY